MNDRFQAFRRIGVLRYRVHAPYVPYEGLVKFVSDYYSHGGEIAFRSAGFPE